MARAETGPRPNPITMTSASQVEAFLRCNRYWYNKSVLKLPEPFSAPAQKGVRVHSISEYWLKSGLLSQPSGTTDEDMEIAQAAIAEMPARGPELLIEQEFRLATYEGGPTWLGYIDLVDPRGDLIEVLDHKTRSDFRYCLKPEDVLRSIQMVSYAKWAMDHFKKDEVLVGHKYVCTKRLKTPPHYKTLLVTAVANRKQVETVWAETMPIVRAMVEWRKAAPKTADDLEPSTQSCGSYGGCAYKPQCGFGPSTSTGPKSTFTIRKKTPMSDAPAPTNGTPRPQSLSEKLAAKKAAAAAAAGTPAPPPPAAPPAGATGIVPPDAPPDVATAPPEPPPPAKAAKAPKKSAARSALLDAANEPESESLPGVLAAREVAAATKPAPIKSEEQKLDDAVRANEEASAFGAPITVPAPGNPITLAKPGKRSLTLFVGCFPVKGCTDFALFEDWAAPLFADVAESMGLSDYRLAQFAAWKPHLANAIRANLDTLPAVLIMSEYGPGVQEALDALTPHATMIVKKLG